MISDAIKNVAIVLLSILLGISVYFLISNNGINITKDNRVITTTNTYANQFGGQLMMNMWMQQGNKVEWKYVKINQFKSIEEVCIFLENLHPTSSYFKEIVDIPYNGSTEEMQHQGRYIIYPNIIQKTKEELLETKTITKTNQE